MRRSPRPDGRMTSISPAFNTKNGTSVRPPSIKTSPRAIGRSTPWAAIRAICADVSVGNMSAASGALVSGVDRMDCVTTSRALEIGSCEPLDELERLLGNLAPAGIDRQRVPAAGHLHDLGHARVA